MPAGTPLIDKLLNTVIQLKASDLHISVGQPPVIRHDSRLRRLDTKVLDSDDTTALMKAITPDRCQQELQEVGGTDFAISFGDNTRFRCAVFKQKSMIGMVLRRIPNQFLTFERDLHPKHDRTALATIFTDLCERVAGDLRRKGYSARTIGIKLRFDDFRTVTRDISLLQPTADPTRIRRAAGDCLRRVVLDRRLRLLGVRTGGLVRSGDTPDDPAGAQGELPL